MKFTMHGLLECLKVKVRLGVGQNRVLTSRKNGERSTNKVTNIELKITSTDLHPLELFNDIFDLKGTIISTDPNLTPSKIERTDTVYKIRYDLIFCNIKTVKEIYANIEMWLSPRRREQCENAISHFEQNISRKGR